jgi:hypothetical protein
LFDPEEYPQDLRDVEFTFRGVQFDGVLDFVRNRGQEPHGGKINYYPSRSRFNSLATKFRRSYDFGSVALNDAYTEKGVSGLRQTMAQEIADISETRFPAFLYSSIQMQPGEENTACNQTGNGAPGLLQASLAEKVSEKFNGTSSVQSICASIYKLEEIKDFGDLFLLQTYEVPDLKDEESIISVGIKAANGEITPLVLGAKDTSLEEVGVVVEGKSLRLNLDVVKSILGIAELKNLSEQERSQIALIVGIVE